MIAVPAKASLSRITEFFAVDEFKEHYLKNPISLSIKFLNQDVKKYIEHAHKDY